MKEATVLAVIGLGYIGLPTAAILANKGVEVIGVDVSARHVEAVNAGRVPFIEPDLAEHVARAVATGRLRAQRETPEANVYIIAVPTPLSKDRKPDLSYVEAATDAIIPHLDGGELIILESTSPPGTTARIADRVLLARPDLSLDPSSGKPVVEFAHCPERVLPGRVMVELVTNDRIVGGLTPAAALHAKQLYETFCEAEIHLTDSSTAEMVKLTENAFRDVNIAFANELSMISERLGINVFELIELANRHPRVSILQPGPGVGGHCIAVDPWFIVDAAPAESKLITTARQVNNDKPRFVMAKIAEAVEGVATPTIAVLGLAFKPDIDDLRESPALAITEQLANDYPQGRILAVEPNIESLPPSLAVFPHVTLCELAPALESADVVALLVDHQEFTEVAPSSALTTHIVDTRGVWRNR